MITKFLEANPELIEFFQALKKKGFWLIQLLNLLRPIQIVIGVLSLCYAGTLTIGAFVTSSSLNLSLVQQREILSNFQEFVLIALIIHLLLKFLPLTFKKDVDDVIVTFCKMMIKIIPLYLIGIGSINLLSAGLVVPSQASIILNNLLKAFPAIVFLILFIVLIIVEKVVRSIIKQRIINDSNITDWLVLVTDQKVTSYDRSAIKLEFYHSTTRHTVDVRFKYSTQHFIFSEISVENGGRVHQKEMNKLLSHLPQFDFEKLLEELEKIKINEEV